MSGDFQARLAGFPHPEGQYTGDVTTDDTGTWYAIAAHDGRDFETQDQPQLYICLGGVAHTEQHVIDMSGTVILAVSEWPLYMRAASV